MSHYLTTKLRDLANQRHRDRGHDAVDDALRDAADEIERMRSERAYIIGFNDGWESAHEQQLGDDRPFESAKAAAQSDFDARIRSALVEKCPGADDPEERCPRHPSECMCWQVDMDHPTVAVERKAEPGPPRPQKASPAKSSSA